MGGHAFNFLQCPLMSPKVYTKVKDITTTALESIFTHVTVPLELPGKADYGDIDFLVSAPFADSAELTHTTFPFPAIIRAIQHALGTPYGRRGFHTPDCMYFAIPMPSISADPTFSPFSLAADKDSDDDMEPWVQVDVKVCYKPGLFSWMTFELNYATQSGILGTKIKPLGLTLGLEGLYVRVEEMEATNWPGSLIFVTKDPWVACRLMNLGRRVVDGGFSSSNEIYAEYAGSRLFHPQNLASKLEDESYLVQHSHRSCFLKKWIPEQYPGYQLNVEECEDLHIWIARVRAAVKEDVSTMFPRVATDYYTKRSQHIRLIIESKLRSLITNAIPSGTEGWSDDFSLPQIITNPSGTENTPRTPRLQPALLGHGQLTPPSSPDDTSIALAAALIRSDAALPVSGSIPVYVDVLSRQPPRPCKPSPPPQSMSAAARQACLARWTAFTTTDTPYLLSQPTAKDFELSWRNAIERGANEGDLVKWARSVWWTIWVRQCVVNWRGMWAKRFEKDDTRAEKESQDVEDEVERKLVADEVEQKAEDSIGKQKAKLVGRLDQLKKVLGLVQGK